MLDTNSAYVNVLKKIASEVLKEDGHIYSYLLALNELYGNDYLDFEPETFREDLGVSGRILDKIMAGIVLKTTSKFWNDIVTFEKVALALNNRSVSFTEYQDLSPAEIAWAVTEAGFITHPEPFGDDVKIYIAKKLHDEGYDLAPFPLGEVQEQLNQVNKLSDISGDRETVQRAKHDAVNEYVLLKLTTLLNSFEGDFYDRS